MSRSPTPPTGHQVICDPHSVTPDIIFGEPVSDNTPCQGTPPLEDQEQGVPSKPTQCPQLEQTGTPLLKGEGYKSKGQGVPSKPTQCPKLERTDTHPLSKGEGQESKGHSKPTQSPKSGRVRQQTLMSMFGAKTQPTPNELGQEVVSDPSHLPQQTTPPTQLTTPPTQLTTPPPQLTTPPPRLTTPPPLGEGEAGDVLIFEPSPMDLELEKFERRLSRHMSITPANQVLPKVAKAGSVASALSKTAAKGTDAPGML